MVSKWWWLRHLGVQSWTIEERRARIALCLTAGAVWLILFFFAEGILELAGVEGHVAPPLAVLLTLVPALLAARPIGMKYFPDTLARGDENAAKRLTTQKSGEP
jgi:hypothetical protein